MLRLKELLFKCRTRQEDFAARCGLSVPHLGMILNARAPVACLEQTRARIIDVAEQLPGALQYLTEQALTIDAIWDVVPNVAYYAQLRNRLKTQPAIVAGDPLYIKPQHEEADMITPKAMKHFKLFRSPFINDISDARDIYMSEDHLFLKMMMLDTARHNGFTAVNGEVGSGKSIMRKAVVQELTAEDIRVIFPIIVDKARITPSSLIDAIIMDISEETPRRTLEAKTRQALRLLRNRAAGGLKQVLIVEEAHLLTVPAMKALKQIYEFEEGFSKLIGIILIGQPELRFLLDESRHPELREVSRRVTIAEISGLAEDVQRYLEHKFKRIGAKIMDIVADDAYAAIASRLQTKDGRRVISKAYPLTVNNLLTRAMNMAADMGEPIVSAEVVLGL